MCVHCARLSQCSNALRIAEQRAIEWQKEIKEVQDAAAAIEAERDALRERLRQLESGRQHEEGSLRERVMQLEATQGHLAVQHGMDFHSMEHRMQMLHAATLGPRALPLPTAVGGPVPLRDQLLYARPGPPVRDGPYVPVTTGGATSNSGSVPPGTPVPFGAVR